MRPFLRLIATFISAWMVSSCFDPPEYPIVPDISFENIRFIDTPDLPNEVVPDSLILEVNFRDGDGDLGISSNEVWPPFNDRWYLLKEPLKPEATFFDDCTSYGNKCWYLKLSELQKYYTFKDIRNGAPGADTLKGFVKPYNCTKWDVVRDNSGKVIDTVYFQLNPYYNNIFIEFQTKNSDSSFSPFDWTDFLTYPICGVQGYNGRFPVLFEPFGTATPLEGVIKYSMPSPFFKIIFSIKTLRLRVYVVDRDLNRSNEILTPEFTLQGN